MLLLEVVLLTLIGKACFSSITIGLGRISLISPFSAPTANAAAVIAVPLPEFVLLLEVVLLTLIGTGCGWFWSDANPMTFTLFHFVKLVGLLIQDNFEVSSFVPFVIRW